jgi:hypothetical protein
VFCARDPIILSEGYALNFRIPPICQIKMFNLCAVESPGLGLDSRHIAFRLSGETGVCTLFAFTTASGIQLRGVVYPLAVHFAVLATLAGVRLSLLAFFSLAGMLSLPLLLLFRCRNGQAKGEAAGENDK